MIRFKHIIPKLRTIGKKKKNQREEVTTKMFLTTFADVCYTRGCNPPLVSPAEVHEVKDELPSVAVCKFRMP